jgi:hypothetical protein
MVDDGYGTPKDCSDVKVDIEQRRFMMLTGKYKHYCPDWDMMAIDETCAEFHACLCKFLKEST